MSSRKLLNKEIISTWEEKWEQSVPLFSNHIRVKKDGYYHHGLYFSDDEVIQFGLGTTYEIANPRNINVQRSTLSEFLQAGVLEVRKYSELELKYAFDEQTIYKNALEKIGSNSYDFIHNNCEHFCISCIFGIKFSFQEELFINEVKKRLG
ncbi:lecithin retinol acyltransferase family protein [Acholeplasma sp. OttesenSCG-928-E16]|nr:lecithin retinol acyltransferase family protein [Acholeplasma sp. OttesenSCG-928-E16]